MRIRRFVSIILTAAFVSASLAACGNSAGSPAGSSAAADAESSTIAAASATEGTETEKTESEAEEETAEAQGAAAAVGGTGTQETFSGSEETLVETKYGQVVGSVEDGIYQYLGIPYADASELFTEAKELAPWDDVFEATSYGPISYQASILGIPASDGGFQTSSNPDNLNIWTPGADGAKRPVMVWLHGGGFSTGTANYDSYSGLNLAKQGDVVMVGVNHRLNIYGHMNLSKYGEKYRFSANAGIMDLVDALEWIRDNIEAFGGDPENVTLFGESGGGAKVLALMSSPYAKGLFKRGIVESGATEGMGVYFEKEEISEELTELILEKLGLGAENADEIQTLSDDVLQAAAVEAQDEIAQKYQIPASLGNGYSMAWEPVVDGDFLPTDPVTDEGFAAGAEEYGLLIGSNLNEWSLYAENLQYNDMTDEQKALYAEAYPNEDPEGAFAVDTLIRLPMLKIMSHKVDQGGEPVYAYVFTHQEGTAGSYHGAELPYVFNNGASDQELADRVSAAWISYARSGVPAVEGVEAWEPYERGQMATMILDDESYLARNHDRDLIASLEPDYRY